MLARSTPQPPPSANAVGVEAGVGGVFLHAWAAHRRASWSLD
jgi:hypothetical protein